MKKSFTVAILLLSSCAPKEQISIFDSNMLIRTAEESEKIAEEITTIKTQCETNRDYIKKSLAKDN